MNHTLCKRSNLYLEQTNCPSICCTLAKTDFFELLIRHGALVNAKNSDGVFIYNLPSTEIFRKEIPLFI